MASAWVFHTVGAFALFRVCFTSGVTRSLLEDHASLLQLTSDVHVQSAAALATIPSPDIQAPAYENTWKCKEGDINLAFQAGRDCKDFTEEELDMPMSTWPYMTRWCKLAHRDKTMEMDQCMAQHCIARQSPSLAAKVWWDTKMSQSTTWQNYEFPYCSESGFCSGHELSHNSTLEDMESFCDKKYKDKWKKLSPRDTLNWIKHGVGDIQMLTCSWGTLHCDVTRCNRYLCGPKAQEAAHERRREMLAEADDVDKQKMLADWAMEAKPDNTASELQHDIVKGLSMKTGNDV